MYKNSKSQMDVTLVNSMLPGGGFCGGEQTGTLPGGGFCGGEQTGTLPGGGFCGGEQTGTFTNDTSA